MYMPVMISIFLLVSTVMLHYEGLRFLSFFVDRVQIPARPRMLLVVFGVVIVHLLEIAIYALAYWMAVEHWSLGEFVGLSERAFANYLYFSAETYATLGLGDIHPLGDLRLIASIEALNGLLLLAWSGSFTYLIMERIWSLQSRR